MKLAKGRISKALGLGVAGLVVMGAIVGAATLGGDGSGGDHVRFAAGGGGSDAAERESSGSLSAQSIGPDAVFESGAAAGSGGGSFDDSAGTVGDGFIAETPEELGGESVAATSENVIKEASVEIELEEGDLAAAQEKALAAVRNVGGFVESSRLSDGTATVTFRVPADDFDAVLSRVRELGEVTSEDRRGEDVSAEVVDLEARLRHWQAQEAVFLDLMGDATTISETIEIRRELGTIQQQIEQIEARMRFLDDRTAFSTLTVSLATPAAGVIPPDDGSSTLSEAWDDAWEAGLSVVGGTLIVLGALVPFSVIVGIPGVILWATLRRRRTEDSAPAPA